MQADPVNPLLRLNLGGVYYLLGRYDQATQFFLQATNLKPDWANAYYNLAWSHFQNKKYAEAVLQMQNVLALVEKTNPDYERAQKELVDFKKSLSKAEKDATTESKLKESNQQEPLDLPAQPEPVITPKLQLAPDSGPQSEGVPVEEKKEATEEAK